MGRFTTTQVLIALTMALVGAPVASADLRSDVKADDQAYRWEHLTQTNRTDGTTVHELRVISQVWQGITWQHRVRMVIPQAPQDMPSLTVLIISGSHPAEQELREAVCMARQLNAPVAILSDIPNQPLCGGLVEVAVTMPHGIDTPASIMWLEFPALPAHWRPHGIRHDADDSWDHIPLRAIL